MQYPGDLLDADAKLGPRRQVRSAQILSSGPIQSIQSVDSFFNADASLYLIPPSRPSSHYEQSCHVLYSLLCASRSSEGE